MTLMTMVDPLSENARKPLQIRIFLFCCDRHRYVSVTTVIIVTACIIPPLLPHKRPVCGFYRKVGHPCCGTVLSPFLPVIPKEYFRCILLSFKRVQASHLTGHGSALPRLLLTLRAEALHPLFRKEHLMKDKKMSIRISEEHLAAIHRKAEQARLSFTDYVTRACLGRQIIVIDGLDEILRQQKAIGRNLNQLTMLCNMGRVSAVSLEETRDQYAKMSAALTELLERKRWSDGNG